MANYGMLRIRVYLVLTSSVSPFCTFLDELSAEGLSEIPKDGYVCLKCAPYCLVYLPSDGPGIRSTVTSVEAIRNVAYHPNYRTNEILITPVVRISRRTTLTLKNPAIIELIRRIHPISDDDEQIVPMFNVNPEKFSEWKKLPIDKYEVLEDRIAFKSTRFGLFAAVIKFQYPSATNSQNPRKIAIPVVPPLNFEVNIPPQVNEEIKATLYFDSTHMCKESDPLATTSFTIEPIYFQFSEKFGVRIPIPDSHYVTVKEKQSDLEQLLELWHCSEKPNEDSDSDSEMTWTPVENAKMEIVDSIAVFDITDSGSYKVLWKPSVKLQNNQAKDLSQVWIKDQVKSIACRCQVFMSQIPNVRESSYNCSIAVLIYPFQDAYKILPNYRYSVYDSGDRPNAITLIAHNLQCSLQLNDELFHRDNKCGKKYVKSTPLSKTSTAQIEFEFDFDYKERIMSGDEFATVIISHGGQVLECKLNLLMVGI